jgi:hypothetical protein
MRNMGARAAHRKIVLTTQITTKESAGRSGQIIRKSMVNYLAFTRVLTRRYGARRLDVFEAVNVGEFVICISDRHCRNPCAARGHSRWTTGAVAPPLHMIAIGKDRMELRVAAADRLRAA